MKDSNEIVVSSKDLESLASKLEKFSENLNKDESIMLTSMLILASNQLDTLNSKGLQINRDKKHLEGLQSGFINAFSRFAPEAFPKPAVSSDRIVSGTVCIE